MGNYVNPNNGAFTIVAGDETYVDKTGLIEFCNNRIGKIRPLICFSRPRRFGKTMAAQMLSAYYSKGCDSKELFTKFKIASSPSFFEELNKNTVIYMDIREFCGIASRAKKIDQVVSFMQTEAIAELKEIYPDIVKSNDGDMPSVLRNIYNSIGEKFIVIIDEWDCLFREDKNNEKMHDEYVNFLRGMFKDGQAEQFIKLAYITGILPIKKYGTQSALNNFREFTMIDPFDLAEYVGFTEDEVIRLCDKYKMDFHECKKWYDGYSFDDVKSVYSPNSVICAVENKRICSYWIETETYETLKNYIDMNFDGVKDAIIDMFAGDRVPIKTRSFQNDLNEIKTKDDVLTLFVHLGYLAYDGDNRSVYIPNEEVRQEFLNATEDSSCVELAKVIKESRELLKATLRMDADEVAKRIQSVHQNSTHTNFYNNEQALRMVIMLAYISRVDDYLDFQEFPSGKGFADILFYPKRKNNKPAILIELKYNDSSDGAIAQIKQNGYCDVIKDFGGEIILVGINYDPKTMEHTCTIEKLSK